MCPDFSPLLAIVRIIGLVLWTAVTVPIHLLVRYIAPGARQIMPRIWHWGVAHIAGIKIERRGVPWVKGPALVVANHGSYIDIPILGTLVAGDFVAKAEVSQWPGMGFLARIAGTLFVAREARKTKGESDELGDRLVEGNKVLLFPEGTSSDGNRVLPFKSSFFAIAEGRNGRNPVPVQPVSITYTGLSGVPLGREWRPLVAWFGDMTLGPHLWQLLQLRGLTVVVTVHPALDPQICRGRKELSRVSEELIRQGCREAIYGWRPALPQPTPVTDASGSDHEQVPQAA